MIGGASFGVDVEIRVRARPETVFAYFTDAARYRTWMGDSAVLDPRPGGRYQVSFPGRPDVQGEYLVVSPPDRLVFTWGWAGSDTIPPGSTTVTVTLTPDGDETVVRLVHAGLPTDGDQAQHREGWQYFLDRLREVTGR